MSTKPVRMTKFISLHMKYSIQPLNMTQMTCTKTVFSIEIVIVIIISTYSKTLKPFRGGSNSCLKESEQQQQK